MIPNRSATVTLTEMKELQNETRTIPDNTLTTSVAYRSGYRVLLPVEVRSTELSMTRVISHTRRGALEDIPSARRMALVVTSDVSVGRDKRLPRSIP